jgi:hypothetical protein
MEQANPIDESIILPKNEIISLNTESESEPELLESQILVNEFQPKFLQVEEHLVRSEDQQDDSQNVRTLTNQSTSQLLIP